MLVPWYLAYVGEPGERLPELIVDRIVSRYMSTFESPPGADTSTVTPKLL